ncbi:MAG: phosphatidate cytidylyltransferase [Phycisphaerales bacterium]|nr:phosphatidate cytidylyltransferase [Phycisphaerales bacterium]
MTTVDRLFGFRHAFDHPFTMWMTLAVVGILAGAWIVILVLRRLGRIGPDVHRELTLRLRSWAILAPLMVVPVLLGAAWTMAAVCVLSILCYREFARATGLFRHRGISLLVAIGILAISFATVDHWYALFGALPPLTVSVIAAVAILRDEPAGYIQRVALAVFAYLFFGVGLGHLGFIANDQDYRPILLMLIAAVELNDVFAYISGKSFGRRKLAPKTSPNKTLGGALGAMVLTTALVVFMGRSVFAGTAMNDVLRLTALGMIISLGGMLGDLLMSSIKRDLGVKDMGASIPGHGGLLDRFDSLLLVAPAAFHFIGYFNGFGLDQADRIITGTG